MFQTLFVKFLINFRPISLKNEISHFSKKSLTPDIEKNSKNGKVSQKFYFARNNLKSLKICPNIICIVSDKFQAYISQK